jgi:hypothetical protein
MLLGNWNHWVLATDAVLLLVPMDCVTGTGLLAAGTFNPKMKSEELSLASQSIPSWNQIKGWLTEMATLRQSAT